MLRNWLFMFIFVIRQHTSMSETKGAYFWSVPNHILEGHGYTHRIGVSLIECVLLCLRDAKCMSVNYGISESYCEMSDSDAFGHHVNYKWRAGIVYLQALKEQVDMSKVAKSIFSAPLQVAGSYPRTCREIYLNGASSGNGIYSIFPSEGSIQRVYCHMDEIGVCGGGGWRLVMKIDGKKQTFAYDSYYWSNKSTYNPDAANRGLDQSETKTSAYWTTNFSKLCLGMKTNNTLAWISLNRYTNTSIFLLIADGIYRPTFVGRGAWLNLVPGSALQPYCNGEGFNLYFNNLRVRIGILGSPTQGCASPGSFLGFGGGGSGCGESLKHVSCGNAHSCDGANGPKSIDTFGYILIQ